MAPEIEAILQKSIDAIEENLRGEIRVEELSRASGFSLFHYYHLFETATGMSVGRYITRRRLLHAAYAMSRGKRAIDAALEYGFDTHAGFYKAFRREFGCAPSSYLRTHRAALPARVNLKEAAKLIDKKEIVRALKAWNMENARVENVYYENTGHKSESTFSVGDAHYIKTSQRLGELQRQARLQKILAQHGLSAEIVSAADGCEIVTSGDTDFMLLKRIDGKGADAIGLMRKPQDAWAIGEGIARLHEVLKTCDPLLCREENLINTLKNWALPKVRDAMQLEEAWVEAYLTHFEALYPFLPTQIIHRDPNPDNILLKEGRVVGFVDFDLSRILPRIFDICYAATGVLSDAFTHMDACGKLAFFDVARAIWQGYDASSPLSPEECDALGDMVIAIQLICVAAFAGSDRFAQLEEINQKMLRMMIENKDKLRI